MVSKGNNKLTITHFWTYFSTVYYKTHQDSDFERLNLDLITYVKESDSSIQRDLVFASFVESGKGNDYIKKNVKIIRGCKSIFGDNLLGIQYNMYTSKYYNTFNKMLKENQIEQFGQNIVKYCMLTDPNIVIDNSHKRIWYLDIEIDNFSNVLTDDSEESSNFDKAVEEQKFPIISITIYDNIEDMYIQLILLPKGNTEEYVQKLKTNTIYNHNEKQTYLFYKTEEDLLVYFDKLMKRLRPEIISGWYSNNFDMPYIINRYYKLSSNIDIDENSTERMFSLIDKIGCYAKRMFNSETDWIVQMPGIELIDYMQIYKKFQMQTPQSFGLDYVQKYEGLGGKTEKKGFMKYLSNFKDFIAYIFKDVEIIQELEKKNSLLKMLCQLQEFAKIPLGKLIHMSNTVEQMIYHTTINNGVVIPSNVLDSNNMDTSFQGATVLEPEDKFYNNVIVLDYESLYPNVIRTFNISPETLILNEQVDEYEKQGLPFIDFTELYYMDKPEEERREVKRIGFSLEMEGVIPKTVNMLITERIRNKKLYKEQADDDPSKQEYYLKQWNYKIVLNSMYGVLGFKYSPLFNIRVAESVTQGQRFMLQFQIDKLRKDNKEIIYGDTDSVFFSDNNISQLTDQKSIENEQKLQKEYVNSSILQRIRYYFINIEDKQYKNYLKTDIDKIFKKVRFFGVKKRYYGIGFDDKEIMHGVELVRTDTPDFQKIILTDLFRKALMETITRENILDAFKIIKNTKDFITLGETKSISKNNYEDYKVIPYHVRGLIFAKKIGLQVPEYITDKLLILPIKIYKERNNVMYNEQNNIFKFTKKKLTIQKINISYPMDKVEDLISYIETLNYIKIDFQEIFNKHILMKLEQFTNLMPIIEELREELNKDAVEEGLTLFNFEKEERSN